MQATRPRPIHVLTACALVAALALPAALAPAGAEAPSPPPYYAIRDAKVVTEPVRAGQQIYARNGDLVVLAPVSPGAEILADGHVHIYSSLKGRAHAGVSGDEAARIFCHEMRAQLISIAGIYLVNEEIDERFLGQRVQIRCMNETICASARSSGKPSGTRREAPLPKTMTSTPRRSARRPTRPR